MLYGDPTVKYVGLEKREIDESVEEENTYKVEKSVVRGAGIFDNFIP